MNGDSSAKHVNLNDAPYKNVNTPIQERVSDLLSRMTLEEKVAQMVGVWQEKNETLLDDKGNFDIIKAQNNYKNRNGLGQVGRPSDSGGGKGAREMALLTNEIQKFFIENSRLGIPVIFHEECLHGHTAPEATSFSQPIGLGATFNPELVRKLFEMTAEEARVRGAHQALTPVVDVAREPRWGRVEETYGEDPYLVAQMGIAAVQGFQGDGTFKNKKHVIATLKHFAAHGQPESGTNCAPVNVSERIIREVFLYPFKEAIQKGGAMSVMASYNEIDGVPSHANRWLLHDVLRREWGFAGFVVSDYYGIIELDELPDVLGHHLAHDKKEAALLAANAGVNIELPEPDCYPHLIELVRKGSLEDSVIDELVATLLEFKFRLGLFDDPYVDPHHAAEVVGSDTNRELARQAARETITLLKNDNNIAPLDVSKIKKLAVIGPNADRELLGGYSSHPKHISTVLEGIRERAGDTIEVLHHEGCKITIGGSWWEAEVVPSNPEDDLASIAEAVKVAEQADAVVLVIGGNEQTSREALDTVHLGDRTNLNMVGLQDELVDAIEATGKPIVAFLFNGRPLSVTNLAEKVPTIFECWYLGQETGRAVAEVLFGDYNPGGKLPITIPQSVGHTPSYYNYKPSARRGYLFDTVEPLFAFGFGLSYTTFEFSNVRLEKTVIAKDESTRVLVDVKNTGTVAGDEVVQMYIRDKVSSVTRPVKELKGFQRITLHPGKSKTVELPITPEHLAFWDINMDYVVEPGEFDIMVGNSSRDDDLQHVLLAVKK
ncbi:glycoside hydrolase family 3 C-terminal domain-containing protein [candidate division KSB1 bacterium]|nr:glycoside hydrolase family 3 C-terminal domain-containing protein [candidate division KSB1 bacterium]